MLYRVTINNSVMIVNIRDCRSGHMGRGRRNLSQIMMMAMINNVSDRDLITTI